VDDGKQALHLVYPDHSKLNSWGNHARNEPVGETKSGVMAQDLLPKSLSREGFHILVLIPL
jgi:hypothetical protein